LADVTFKPKRDPHKKRLPFSADDRRLILIEARGADPLIRWTAWVGAFSGMRLGEIVDAHTRDVMQLEGHWVFRIGVEHRETSIKTETSLRDVPIHSAVIREGFLDYVGALGSGPLFPMITPDRRCRTTVPSRFGKTAAKRPFTGDQVVCLSRDQARHRSHGWKTAAGSRLSRGHRQRNTDEALCHLPHEYEHRRPDVG
jgi:integrase